MLLAGDLPPIDDLAPLSDEFSDAASIANWQRVNEVENWNVEQLQIWDIDQTQSDRMVMVPHTVVWFQDWRGPMAFKEVTGDFVVTSEVHIADRDELGDSDADDVPDDAQFSLGGLMIRTPRDIQDPTSDWAAGSRADDGTNNGENYVFLSMGHGTNGNWTFEVKTTRNSDSQLELTPMNSSTATLQIARIGDAVIALYQLPGEDWVVHRRYHRADMPETLQVGMVSYSDWEKAGDFDPFYHNSHVLEPGAIDPTPGEPFNPDLVASFEYARYARPVVPVRFQGMDLVSSVSVEQLLTFLGDNANPVPGNSRDDDLQQINQLLAAIQAGNAAADFDFDGSGSVDQGDIEFLVENTLGTLMGDANLDGSVDAGDLNQLGLHWQSDDAVCWEDGDFNGDGTINSLDLNILGLNWQQSVDRLLESDHHRRAPRAPLSEVGEIRPSLTTDRSEVRRFVSRHRVSRAEMAQTGTLDQRDTPFQKWPGKPSDRGDSSKRIEKRREAFSSGELPYLSGRARALWCVQAFTIPVGSRPAAKTCLAALHDAFAVFEADLVDVVLSRYGSKPSPP